MELFLISQLFICCHTFEASLSTTNTIKFIEFLHNSMTDGSPTFDWLYVIPTSQSLVDHRFRKCPDLMQFALGLVSEEAHNDNCDDRIK
jgi:hypothetical protein